MFETWVRPLRNYEKMFYKGVASSFEDFIQRTLKDCITYKKIHPLTCELID